MRLRLSLVLGLTVLLASCNGGGSVTPPPEPAPNPIYTPSGAWNGQRTTGPWCANKPGTQSVKAAQSESLLTVPTTQMKTLMGLSLAGMTGQALRAQSAGTTELAVMLPTDRPYAESTQALADGGVKFNDTFGYWITADATQIGAVQAAYSKGLVQYAEVLPEIKPAAMPTPNDLNQPNIQKYLPTTNTQAAWATLDLGCDHPIVAVIDTGMWGATTQTEYNLVPKSAWFDAHFGVQGHANPSNTELGEYRHYHGAAVAGVIAAATNNGKVGAGITYNLVKVLPINAMDPVGGMSGTGISRAIEYALGSTTIDGVTFKNPYPANVLNMSFGTAATLTPSQFYQAAYAAAAAQGVVIVGAAGNENAHGTTDTAGLKYSIGVAGIGFDGNRWVTGPGEGSNYGPGVDVAAPGFAVPTLVDDKEMWWTGTSMAAPWVSGQVALWMYANQQYRPDGSRTQGLTGDALYNKLYACFTAVGSNGGAKDEYMGYGKIDTARLVSATETACR